MEGMAANLSYSAPVRARMTSVLDQDVHFDLRLTDISNAGLAGVADRAAVERAGPGPFWAEFELPGSDRRHEYVVRLKHCVPGRAGEQAVVGWAFCGADQPASDRAAMARIRAALSRREKKLSVWPSGPLAHITEGKPC